VQLSFAERKLVKIVAGSYADVVERRLAAQSQTLQSQRLTQRNRFVVLAINLFRLAHLALQLAVAHSHFNRVTDADIFLEINHESFDKRIQYLDWNAPGRRFEGVSYNDRLLSAGNRYPLWRILFWLSAAILLSVFRPPSQLTSNLVRVVRTCLLAYSRARSSTTRTIYLFRIYRIETPFVAAFLMERGIVVHLVASSSPLSAHNRVLIGDSVKLCHPYQIDEFAFYQDLGACRSCELWSPETMFQLQPHYKNVTLSDHFDIIGLYTQGFRLREELGTLHPDFAAGAVRRERELLSMATAFAQEHPHIRLVIFPHPLERRHYRQSGQHQFGSLVGLPNVEMELSEASSTLQFERVGLGLTLLSSIGFERIYLGFRTIFFVSDLDFVNWDISSPYHRIFFTEQDEFRAAIEKTCAMSHCRFMKRYFDGASYPDLWTTCPTRKSHKND
jgi:hypothetical protein